MIYGRKKFHDHFRDKIEESIFLKLWLRGLGMEHRIVEKIGTLYHWFDFIPRLEEDRLKD